MSSSGLERGVSLSLALVVWLGAGCAEPLQVSSSGANNETTVVEQGMENNRTTPSNPNESGGKSGSSRCADGVVSVEMLGAVDENGEPHPLVKEAAARLMSGFSEEELARLTSVDWSAVPPEALVLDPLMKRASLRVASLVRNIEIVATNEDCSTSLRTQALDCDAECFANVVVGTAAGLAAILATVAVCSVPEPTFSKVACVALVSLIVSQTSKAFGGELPSCGYMDEYCCPDEEGTLDTCLRQEQCLCPEGGDCDPVEKRCLGCGTAGQLCCPNSANGGCLDGEKLSCVSERCCYVSDCAPGSEACRPYEEVGGIIAPFYCVAEPDGCGGTSYVWAPMDATRCESSSLYNEDAQACCVD